MRLGFLTMLLQNVFATKPKFSGFTTVTEMSDTNSFKYVRKIFRQISPYEEMLKVESF